MTKLAELIAWWENQPRGWLPDGIEIIDKARSLLAEEQAVPVKDVGEAGLREFNSFCDKYIEAAETEWDKTDNQTDLAAATVAKILQNKFNELVTKWPPPTPSSQAEKVDGGLSEEMTIYNNTIIRSLDMRIWREVDAILSRYSKEAK